MAKPFYSLDEVSSMLGKSPEQITSMVRAGTLREFRDSGKIFFKAEDVERLRSSTAGASPGDSGEITLESIEEAPRAPAGRADDSLPSLVDTSGGTSIIGLADIDEEPAKPAARGAAPARPADRKEGTKGPRLGVGVFDDDDVELDADPLAKTQVTGSAGAASEQMSLKEGTGSGSGLLDLTRESDDTSLGAELLDEIYPGEEEAASVAATPARKAADAAASAAAASASASAAAASAARAAAEVEEDDTAAMAAAREEVVAVAPVRVATSDLLEPLFGMMLVWGLVLLALAGLVAAAVQQGFLPDFGAFLTTRFWIFLAAAFGGLALFSLIGWLIGRSSAAPATPRAPKAKPARAPAAAKAPAKKKTKGKGK